MKKQVALIGVSGYGEIHLGALLTLAKEGIIDIAAAVIRSREAEARQLELLKEYPVRIYLDTDEFFSKEAGKIDLVCLPTSINSHEYLTIQALRSRMNVLVEKPVSGSVESVERMIRAAEESGKFAAVGFQHCYAPEITLIKELLLSGRLGKIKECYAAACWPRDDNYYHRNDWSAKRSVNGVTILDSPLNNACAHYLNLLLFLNSPDRFGTAHCVDVKGEVLRARPEIEMFDACNICYTLENGIKLNAAFVHCCEDHLDAQLHIICEKGRIFWRSNADWEVKDAQGEVIASGMGELPVEAMFRRVVAKLDDPSLPVYTLKNGMELTVCVEMLDKKCEITPVEAEKKNGIYCVPGIRDKVASALPEQR